MVSHKINATRKRMNIIVMHKNTQIIFVDTPGIHRQEKLLNKFMLNESYKAIGDCDFLLFLAPVYDSLDNYRDFLELIEGKKHALLLSKCDEVRNGEILKKIDEYKEFDTLYSALIPISSKNGIGKEELLRVVSQNLPTSPYLFDPQDLTTVNLREIYKELIRESLFKNLNEEIPYQSDVLVTKVEEGDELDRIYAKVITEKESQKRVIIGKGGECIKRIGIFARKEIERLCEKKVFLSLSVEVIKGWSKDRESLKMLGYNLE